MAAQVFKALSIPTNSRPSLERESLAFGHNFLRDQFTIGTWLLLGALLQAVLFILPIRPAFAISPAIFLLSWQIIDAALMSFGLKQNTYLDNVIQTKYTALLPNANGAFTRASVGQGTDGEGKPVCVFILGFRVNHPLGVAAPGAFKIMQHFLEMRDDLETHAAAGNGFLGAEYLLNSGHRTNRSEIKSLWYFTSNEDCLRWAHGDVHRKGWDFYNKAVKQYNHLGIMHEMYEAPQGAWENIYVNHQPVGFASISTPLKGENGKISWADPTVDARKGRLASTAGRLGKNVSD